MPVSARSCWYKISKILQFFWYISYFLMELTLHFSSCGILSSNLPTKSCGGRSCKFSCKTAASGVVITKSFRKGRLVFSDREEKLFGKRCPAGHLGVHSFQVFLTPKTLIPSLSFLPNVQLIHNILTLEAWWDSLFNSYCNSAFLIIRFSFWSLAFLAWGCKK